MLLAAVPVLAAAGLCVLLADGWPVMFAQKRTGKDKKTFIIYKIRTMVKNAEVIKKRLLHLNQAPAPMFKIFNDPRFIPGGKFLSTTGIDELPQLWNVVKGEMSLVGPRPLPVSEAKKLGKPWQFRFLVRPGLFSEWTVDGRRHKNGLIWKKLEQETVFHGNIVTDLSLILRTIFVTMTKQIKKLF
jgi:lipopolysaccharide/colanic/teichoic acid biosynthesis glycosyltransferase